MRLLYAVIALVCWVALITYCVREGMQNPSTDIQLVTSAIIIAGALAGGD